MRPALATRGAGGADFAGIAESPPTLVETKPTLPQDPPDPLLFFCLEEDSTVPITVPGRLPVSLAGHPVVAAQAAAVQAAAAQAAVAAQAAALEQLREKLESTEPPEKKMALVADEQQRLMQRALQQNFLAMTAQLPMNIRINSQGTLSLEPSTFHGCLGPFYVKSHTNQTRSSRASTFMGNLSLSCWEAASSKEVLTSTSSVLHGALGLTRGGAHLLAQQEAELHRDTCS